MSHFSDLRHPPAATNAAGDPTVPLTNLSAVQTRLDNLHRLLSDSVNGNVLLGRSEMGMISEEIASAIDQIIVNGGALLSCACTPSVCSFASEKKTEDFDDFEIVEIDAVELLAEHVHFCEVCGKGFKRDANLRMHMRAHGDEYKTAEALAGPEKGTGRGRRRRFSCPYEGCNRNKKSEKFKALKSVICVKNHYRRSHCPKMYSCDRCNGKSFSVFADLRSHMRHCGENKWRCSCGTRFSRKDKLFGHMALFEGHMPAVVEEEKEKGKTAAASSSAMVEDGEVSGEGGMEGSNVFLDGFLDELDDYCIQDELNVNNEMEGWFNF